MIGIAWVLQSCCVLISQLCPIDYNKNGNGITLKIEKKKGNYTKLLESKCQKQKISLFLGYQKEV
jgi:hypothetical protein